MCGLFVSWYSFSLRAFTVTAYATDRTAAFMLNDSATFRAGTPIKGFFFKVDFGVTQSRMGLDGLGNRVGTGEDLVVAETRLCMARNSQ